MSGAVEFPMGTLSYTMNISLDGDIEDLTGGIAFSEPDEELHRFANQQTRETAAFLFGRGLYEVMEEFWTAPERADGHEVEAEFAREYAATPRIVFSDSLESVAPGCRLVRRANAIDEVLRLKKETDGDLSVGGAGPAQPPRRHPDVCAPTTTEPPGTGCSRSIP